MQTAQGCGDPHEAQDDEAGDLTCWESYGMVRPRPSAKYQYYSLRMII